MGETTVVQPSGELDMATVDEVRSALAASTETPRTILDLSGVSFIDTSGVRLIISEREAATEAGRELRLVSGPPEVQRIFELIGLTERMRFEKSVDEAAEAVT